MSDVHALLARCQALGAEIIPTPHGTLKVAAPAPLPEELRAELKQRKAEVLVVLTQHPTSVVESWPCSYCGRSAEIEDVCPSLDGKRILTLWRCEPCQTYGVTPNTLPPVWVKKQKQ